jgi:soluble lytic murein transglycosylase-like protein
MSLRRLAPLVGAVLVLAGCESPTGVSPSILIMKPTGTTPGMPATGATQVPADAASAEQVIRPIAHRNATLLGVPEGLVMAVISQESGFRPTAVSPVGAQGLMQLMPTTVQDINKAGEVQVLDPFDAEQNVAGGTWYLRWVKRMVPADKVVAGEEWKFALGGYNGGIGRVRTAIDKALAGAPRNPKVTWADIAAQMPGETQRYVPSVVAKWDKYGR